MRSLSRSASRSPRAILPVALFVLAYVSVLVLVAAPRGTISALPAAAVTTGSR